MRLTKLEINGFKSFARRTEIAFSGGVTAVIGPNGSGKSNISDAIKWVLGEQSARALRGAKMEDVIFNGTEQRKAQAYCEVTLTFDNADGMLNVPFAEVAITRRVYRSGESEYCINKNACRLRDIQELFRDTGIGRDGYSIIGQGRVDEILSNKSGDRRAALEEAAGVMRYRARKEEAERKLDNTGKNLERIEDIVQELADRLGPLEEQSASARAYLKLRDELKDLEINQFLYQYERGSERIQAARAAIEQMNAEQTAAAEGETAALAACASLEEQARGLDASLTERQNRLMARMAGMETRVGERKVLAERIEHADKEYARCGEELAACRARVQTLQATLDDMRVGDAGGAALNALDAEIADAETRLTALDGNVAAAEDALEALKAAIIEAMNRASDYRSSISRLDAMENAVRERMAALDGERERAAAEEKRLDDECAAAEDTARAGREKLAAAKESLRETIERRRAMQEAYAALREDTHRAEQAESAAQSRLRVLAEMQKSREGYYNSVRSVMRDVPNDARLSHAVIGVVAELLTVPQEYELAVSMAMGSSMQNIVTPTAEDAQYVIEHLRRNQYGRATLLPLALLHPSTIRRDEREFLRTDGCIGVASELVECDERIRTAVDHLLGRTVIVKDLESGVALKKRSRGAFHIATLEGDIISTSGSMSGGSVNKKQFSLLGREREIKELGATLGTMQRALMEKKRRMTESEREMLLCDTQVDAFREEVHACEVDMTRQDEQLEIVRRDRETVQNRIGTLQEECAQLDENMSDITAERGKALSGQEDVARGSDATKEDVRAAQTGLTELKQTREALSGEITERRVRRMAFLKERDAAENERKRLTAEHAEAARRADALEKEIEGNRAQAAALRETLSGLSRGIEGEQSAAEEEKAQQQKLEDERAKLTEALAEQRARREELLQSGRELSERLHKQELTASRLEMELASMQDHVWEEYELTYENALAFRHDFAVGAASARVQQIKAEMKELGDVNPGAIDDYQAVSARHEALTAQCEDLQKAKADLESLIVELTDTMREVFLRQFDVIQSNFTQVFSELFGGGYAELRLGDSGDVLNCDIDIIAQPPGKKLQLLSLLSGGERALTAIALLFAMLKLKPPAFCVLDEIESSLDEVNVSRFAGYVKAYSGGTQFILITHRKGSMEICDTLYGVSMEEKGVSKVVSARFGEADA